MLKHFIETKNANLLDAGMSPCILYCLAKYALLCVSACMCENKGTKSKPLFEYLCVCVCVRVCGRAARLC